MFRVMLIDDEPLALEGLETLIDWQRLGFSVVAKCRDGLEAMAQIGSAAPDLIVTDIYMPGMDGISLMAQLMAQGYSGEFLIVSGYGEFEKARRALQLGASGYILKPVDTDEANEAIMTARDRIIHKKLRGESAKTTPEYSRALYDALVGDAFPEGILPTEGDWHILTWGSALPVECAALMRDAVRSEGAFAAVVMLGGIETMALHTDKCADGAVKAVTALAEGEGREVVCERACSPSDMNNAYKRICEALDTKWTKAAEMLNVMERLAALRRPDEYRSACNEVLSACRSIGGLSESRITDLWYARCVRLLEEAPEKLSAFLQRISNRRDIIESGLAVIELLTPDERKLSDVVISNLRERYAENITLDGLAAALGYNPAYLGRVFRDETGMTFRAWLNDFRVKRAAQLLTETDRPAQDIAVSVGFHKYSNFLEHFKLSFGVTPDAYRRAARRQVQ